MNHLSAKAKILGVAAVLAALVGVGLTVMQAAQAGDKKAPKDDSGISISRLGF